MAKVREFTSGLIHCIGAALSLVGLVILIVFSTINGDAYDVVSFTIWGSSLLLTYLFSTLYHWLNIGKKGINLFKKFDNIMIYILIATSYTPISLGPLRGPWGWSIFGIVWGLAVLGIIFSSIWTKIPKPATLPINISLFCITIIAIIPLIQVYKQTNLLYSLWWLTMSGLFYTIGGFINALKWPKNKFKQFGFHEIFHIFVIFGSACQYWFILNYVTMF